ncbi:MAG TPA: alpha/beta fold hydrolase [Steroidobacteraceae bacterium]|nr:alpha/beta fold hydrolase [Steroidobacteraceae bacterium]
MPRWILIVAAVAVVLYIAFCGILFAFQRSLIYYPQPDAGPRSADTLTLALGGAQVLVSTAPHDGPDAVIYFGGNAEEVWRGLPDLKAAFPDRALYLLNYRGYGGSTGKPSEAALVADALALFDRVHAEHPRIAVIGRSLGGAVAVHVASLRRIEHLALITPFNSLEEIAARQFPFVPLHWLLLDKFESWRYAPAVTAPTLILAAQHDEVIPRSSTESLLTHFPRGLATLTIVEGAGHNTISESPEFIPLLRSALGAAPARNAEP